MTMSTTTGDVVSLLLVAKDRPTGGLIQPLGGNGDSGGQELEDRGAEAIAGVVRRFRGMESALCGSGREPDPLPEGSCFLDRLCGNSLGWTDLLPPAPSQFLPASPHLWGLPAIKGDVAVTAEELFGPFAQAEGQGPAELSPRLSWLDHGIDVSTLRGNFGVSEPGCVVGY
jgi:hypothetical protein